MMRVINFIIVETFLRKLLAPLAEYLLEGGNKINEAPFNETSLYIINSLLTFENTMALYSQLEIFMCNGLLCLFEANLSKENSSSTIL